MSSVSSTDPPPWDNGEVSDLEALFHAFPEPHRYEIERGWHAD